MVLERGAAVAGGQTGANSGVIHAGIYYLPGSLKARLCVEGAREMYEFCEREGIEHERCGKVIVARSDAELGRLDELERRGRENQVPGLRRLSAAELAEVEPPCRGVAGLHSPETGIVDFAEVARAVARELSDGGTPVALEHGIRSVRAGNGRITLAHDRGETRARFAVFCAGVGSDKLAVAAGASPDPRIVPFRGAYLYLRPEKRALVRSMIYPVPDPSLPFLGVHLTRHIDGHVSLGPTALLAPRSLGDLVWPGTIKMGLKWWRTGITEIRHRLSQRTLARAAADYVPEHRPRRLRRRLRRPARPGARTRRQAGRRLRRLGDRTRPARAQRAVAGGNVLVRAGAADRGPGRARPA